MPTNQLCSICFCTSLNDPVITQLHLETTGWSLAINLSSRHAIIEDAMNYGLSVAFAQDRRDVGQTSQVLADWVQGHLIDRVDGHGQPEDRQETCKVIH